MADEPTEEEAPLSPFEQSFLDVINARFADPGESEDQATSDAVPVEGHEASEVVGERPAVEGEPTGGGDGQPTPAFTLSGVDYTPEQLDRAIQVHDWFARLPPQQVQAIDALLSGQYQLTPAQQQYQQAQQQQQEQVQAQTGTAVSSGQPPSLGEGDWLDPQAQQAFNTVQQQLDEIKQTFAQTMQPVVQRHVDTDYQTRLGQITAASETFQKKYDLSQEDLSNLENAIAQAQILPSLASRYGSVDAGMTAALEMYFWATPQYRDHYLQTTENARQADSEAQDRASLRKQQLTALSASGGSAPRREPVPSTPEDRHAAMTAEIAAAMNGSGTIE